MMGCTVFSSSVGWPDIFLGSELELAPVNDDDEEIDMLDWGKMMLALPSKDIQRSAKKSFDAGKQAFCK